MRRSPWHWSPGPWEPTRPVSRPCQGFWGGLGKALVPLEPQDTAGQESGWNFRRTPVNLDKEFTGFSVTGIKLDQQNRQPPGPSYRPACGSLFSFLIVGLGVSRGLKGVSKPSTPMTGAQFCEDRMGLRDLTGHLTSILHVSPNLNFPTCKMGIVIFVPGNGQGLQAPHKCQ